MGYAIAIVSIVSSATVAVAVPIVSARLETRRLRLQVREARFDELRSVLDSSALSLREAMYELNGAVSLLDQDLDGALGNGPTVAEVVQRLADKNVEVFEYGLRLSLRLGRQATIVSMYEACGSACSEGWELLTEVTWGEHPYDAARKERASTLMGQAEHLQQAFIDAAPALIGPPND